MEPGAGRVRDAQVPNNASLKSLVTQAHVQDIRLRTLVTEGRLAWRAARLEAARASRHGLRILTAPQLAARLAGGFLQPRSREALQEAVADALGQGGFREIDAIAELPGMVRAASTTLERAWAAALDLQARAGEHPRIADMALIERRVHEALPPAMHPPRELAARALGRAGHAPNLLGPVEFRGILHLDPCWRPLVAALAQHVPVRWHAVAGADTAWLEGAGIEVIPAEAHEAEFDTVTCANPRHEALEALRWARALIAEGRAAPADIAIAAAAPAEWDEAIEAGARDAGLPVHFAHGRRALWTRDGQRCAALAQVLEHGLSQARVVRLVRLLDGEGEAFAGLPEGWHRALPDEAALLELGHWRHALARAGEKDNKYKGLSDILLPTLKLLAGGTAVAREAGERLLRSRARALWQRALRDGPPEALEVTLEDLRVPDEGEPGAAIVWTPAAALAAAPRPWVRLLGLNSRWWPRPAVDDPLLPDHLIPREALVPLATPERDRRCFEAIRAGARTLICSRARRDRDGRVLGRSPLLPETPPERGYLRRARVPEHAAGEADRLFARPRELAATDRALSTRDCWTDWRREAMTAHDGVVRRDHPVIRRAVARTHSASSLRKLLRDPLGFVWQYALGWQAPAESEPVLILDALQRGSLVHDLLEIAVAHLEADGGLAGADLARRDRALDLAAEEIAETWALERPVPPGLLWRSALAGARALAARALEMDGPGPADQRSWVEVPFGREGRGSPRIAPPWDPATPVRTPRAGIPISGRIDRLDVAENARLARVTDYKTGRPPRADQAPELDGGAELQRCLYAFAVRELLPDVARVQARLLYVRAEDGIHGLEDPEATLTTLDEYLARARAELLAGHAVPGPDADSGYNDLLFALPANARGLYFERKREPAKKMLQTLATLWELP